MIRASRVPVRKIMRLPPLKPERASLIVGRIIGHWLPFVNRLGNRRVGGVAKGGLRGIARCGLDKLAEGEGSEAIEVGLKELGELPGLTGQLGDFLAPLAGGGILCGDGPLVVPADALCLDQIARGVGFD